MTDIVRIMMSNHFYFSISNNDESNYFSGTMEILDFDLAYHHGISEMFYGFRRHDGGFTIEGYAVFGVDISDNEVHDLLPGFEVRRYAFIHDAYAMCARVTETSLFTKHGAVWDDDFVDLHFEWHIHDINENRNQEN